MSILSFLVKQKWFNEYLNIYPIMHSMSQKQKLKFWMLERK